MTKIVKLQALIRGKSLRKKYNIKSTYRAKETETYSYNYNYNNSEIRSINIGSDIINDAAIKVEYVIPGMIIMVIGIIAAYIKYTKKDIQ